MSGFAQQGGDAQAESQTETTVDDLDVDEIELRDAKAALAAEGETRPEGTTQTAQESDGGKAAEAQKPQTPPQDAKSPDHGGESRQDQVMIPKPRFDEVNQRALRAEQQAAYLQGQLDALKAGGQPQQQINQQRQEPGHQQPLNASEVIKALKEQDQALAKAYDDGDLTMAQLTEKRAAIEDQIAQAREIDLQQRLAPRLTRADTRAASAHIVAMVDRAADRAGLPRELLRFHVARESGFRPHAKNPRSTAKGLLQVIHGTHEAIIGERMSRAEHLRRMADPAHALAVGIAHIKACRDLMPRADARTLWRRCHVQGHAAVGGRVEMARAYYQPDSAGWLARDTTAAPWWRG